MIATSRRLVRALTLFAAMSAPAAALAHSASDAYLTLEVDPPRAGTTGAAIHGQWNIALRDLDFVLALDDNGDGEITWGELRKHEAQVVRYAFDSLHATRGGSACEIRPGTMKVQDLADGAYAALFFDIVCASWSRPTTLDYRLFFGIDPSHRAIVVVRSGGDIATSVLSPEHRQIDVAP